jgi:ribosomal protein S27AE
MTNERAALDRMLEQLVELGVIEFCPEPLNASVERRLKAVWAARSCPNCSETSLQVLDESSRIWCGRCDWKTTYTHGTPFYNESLPSSSTLTHRSASTRSPSSSRRATRRSILESERSKLRSSGASRLSGRFAPRQSLGRRRSMKPSRCVRASKGKSRRGRVSIAAVHQKVDGHAGRESKVMN